MPVNYPGGTDLNITTDSNILMNTHNNNLNDGNETVSGDNNNSLDQHQSMFMAQIQAI